MKNVKQTPCGMTFASRNVLLSFYRRPRLRKSALSRQVDCKAWLAAIRGYIDANVAIPPQDLMEAREFASFAGRGGLTRARALFGTQLERMLGELPLVLVAGVRGYCTPATQ
jgi:hypothetical protein